MNTIETFLFKQFPNQPLWVRVLTYIVLLGVFVYLILIPRFIDGQLVVKDQSTGGIIPYRGANIQMQVDGRDYKFKSNEGGYFSIPIVSRLPTSIEFQVFHEDKAQWFKVKLSAMETWVSGSRQVEMSDSDPFIKVTAATTTDVLSRLPAPGLSEAHAAVLYIPSPRSASTDDRTPQPHTQSPGAAASHSPEPSEKSNVRQEVVLEISKVIGKSPEQIGNEYPLIGTHAPSYIERIQIIEKLEQHFSLKIPDEHWKALANVQQLVDYIQQRNLLQKRYPQLKNVSDDWPSIQQSLPTDQRPVFRP